MKEYGIVYLLTNPVMPGLVKIGMTNREDIDARLKELYTTGVPVPFECQFACKVDKNDCAKIEQALHTAFAPQRVNANREFFRIQVEQARAILELFHHDDVTEEVAQEIENDLTDDDRNATKKSRSARPRLNFFEMGIGKGSILYWKEDPSITIHSYLMPVQIKLQQNRLSFYHQGNNPQHLNFSLKKLHQCTPS